MGRTPLYWAASSGEAQVMRFLMKEGATPNLKNSIGRSALSKAAWNSSVECVEILLSYPDVSENKSRLKSTLEMKISAHLFTMRVGVLKEAELARNPHLFLKILLNAPECCYHMERVLS